MKAKSIQGSTLEDIRNELEKAIQDEFKPTLAFVFLSDVEDIEGILKLMNEKQIEIYGASTSAQFTDKGIEESGISMLLLDLNPEHFKIEIKNLEKGSTFEASKQIAKLAKNNFQNPGFIVSGVSLNTPGEYIIEGITKITGKETTIIGGMAGEPVYFKGKVFNNREAYSKGIVTLIVDQDKVELSGVAVSGWKPVGTEKTITNCEDYWIKTIDNKPALEIFKKFMGEEFVLEEFMEKENIIPLNTTFPLQIIRNDGYAVMRPPLFANLQEQSILCGGLVQEGNVFRFSLPPDFEVIDKVIKTSTQIKETKMPDADALIIFSCVGRLASLGPLISDELEGLAGTWKKPMAGFFCLGEFGKIDGANTPEFHGTTCSWVAMKEK